MNTSENIRLSWQEEWSKGEKAERERFARLNHAGLLIAMKQGRAVNAYFSLWYVMGETKNLALFGWPLFHYLKQSGLEPLDRYHAGTNLGRLMGLADDDQRMKPIILTRTHPSREAFLKIERLLIKSIGESPVSLP